MRVFSCAGGRWGCLCAACVLFVPSGWRARHGTAGSRPRRPWAPAVSHHQDKGAGLTARETWGCLQRFENSEANYSASASAGQGVWASLCHIHRGCYPLTIRWEGPRLAACGAVAVAGKARHMPVTHGYGRMVWTTGGKERSVLSSTGRRSQLTCE